MNDYKATRYFLKCPECKAFKVIDLLYKDGTFHRWDLDTDTYTPTAWLTERVCPCGTLANATTVAGSYNHKHICDPACTSARYHVCVCACGGENHGASWAGAKTWYIVFNPKARKKDAAVEYTDELAAALKIEREAKKAALADARERGMWITRIANAIDRAVEKDSFYQEHEADLGWLLNADALTAFAAKLREQYLETGWLSVGQLYWVSKLRQEAA